MLHRRVVSCRGVEIFSGLLAFDNYVPSQNYGGWFASEQASEQASERERERVARRFSARWAPLCSEVKRTVQARLSFSPIPRFHFAAVYSSPAEDDSAVLQSSFPQIPIAWFPPFALCLFLFAIESRIYSIACRILDSLSSSSFWRISFAASLFPGTSIDCCLLSHLHSNIIRVYSYLSIHRTCIRIYVAILVPSFLDPFSFTLHFLILSPLAPLPRRDL